MKRFLNAGEGRVDSIGAYMDGFHMWKTIFDRNIYGVIRGDEGFGWRSAYEEFDVRRNVQMIKLSDFKDLKKFENKATASITANTISNKRSILILMLKRWMHKRSALIYFSYPFCSVHFLQQTILLA